MAADPANVHALAEIASEIGADVHPSDLRYPSKSRGWQFSHTDLRDDLNRYQDQRRRVDHRKS